MKSSIILLVAILAGCVSGDCTEDCYPLELKKPNERLDFKCETIIFHPHCKRSQNKQVLEIQQA